MLLVMEETGSEGAREEERKIKGEVKRMVQELREEMNSGAQV